MSLALNKKKYILCWLVIYAVVFFTYLYFVISDIVFFDILSYLFVLCLHAIFIIVITIQSAITIKTLIKCLLLLIVFIPIAYTLLPFELRITELANQILFLPVFWISRVWFSKDDTIFNITKNYKIRVVRIICGMIIGGTFACLLLSPRMLTGHVDVGDIIGMLFGGMICGLYFGNLFVFSND
jgi:hypothetical protein